MISAKRIFVWFLVACFHYCAAKPEELRIEFEDCGIKVKFNFGSVTNFAHFYQAAS
jgi:hypothetical protein